VPGLAVRVLFLNTFLLRVGRLPSGRWLHEKPMVDERADEIGVAVADGYDVVALAEVFHPDEVHRLLAAAGVDPDAAARGVLASPPSALTSSGLLSFAGHPIVRQQAIAYRQRGRKLLDSDAWANKGALMVEVDLGLPGNLEVYSTHVFFGGDLVRSDARHRSPELPRIRQAQVQELLGFVDAVHRPENVALVVGDFNIDAEGRGPDGLAEAGVGVQAAERLRRSFDDAGFDDAWALVGEGPGWTCDLVEAPEGFGLDEDDPDHCAEPAPPRRPGQHLSRIDHAYLQRPVPSHRLEVQVDRLRRRPFTRAADAPGRDRIATGSDHLGLHLELSVEGRMT
jgi:endonuclease/exonuclease/phosphatase family metal-dependent hydrolase